MRKPTIILFFVICLFMAGQVLIYEQVSEAVQAKSQFSNGKAFPGVLMLLLDDEEKVECVVDADCVDKDACTMNTICENGVCLGYSLQDSG